MAAKDYAATRYAELDEINAGNASRLALAFSFSTGLVRGHEAAPLVAGGTMYVVTPYPNYVYALSLRAFKSFKSFSACFTWDL
jgi:glucose dehydrogenase